MEEIKTKRGVYKNLDASPYSFKIGKYTFKFSSQAKLNKFKYLIAKKQSQFELYYCRLYGNSNDELRDYLITELYRLTYENLKNK